MSYEKYTKEYYQDRIEKLTIDIKHISHKMSKSLDSKEIQLLHSEKQYLLNELNNYAGALD